MMSKIWGYFKLAINVGLMIFGLVYMVMNFQAMIPTIAAIVILAIIFKVFGLEKKPPTKKD